MQLVANALNGQYFQNILPGPDDEVDYVLAAIAYGDEIRTVDSDLIGHCAKNGYRLDIWMRYDETVPVTPKLLRKILGHHKNNIFCSLIPDCLHSKVIWWKGYGAYIGSANHTDRAWVSNIEAGVFLSESDLEKDNMSMELENFFDALRNTEEAIPLSEDIIQELEKIASTKAPLTSSPARTIPKWNGPIFQGNQRAVDRRKTSFQREWLETLGHLRAIGNQLKNHRPSWVDASIPIEWQIDQFLHAYYYNRVGDSRKKPYEEYFSTNKSNPNKAISEAIAWWEKTPSAPSNENITFYESAPLLQQYLAKDKILNLTIDEFAQICAATHATKDHIMKIELSTLGRPDVTHMPSKERISLFASWLISQTNKRGWNVLQLLHFVLYEGTDSELWGRLYTASKDPNYSLPHYGLNSIAEVIGWARPEIAPPRNGRTSKALRALGLSVRIY